MTYLLETKILTVIISSHMCYQVQRGMIKYILALMMIAPESRQGLMCQMRRYLVMLYSPEMISC